MLQVEQRKLSLYYRIHSFSIPALPGRNILRFPVLLVNSLTFGALSVLVSLWRKTSAVIAEENSIRSFLLRAQYLSPELFADVGQIILLIAFVS